MFDVILQGIFLGLVLTIFVGPVFFMLIETSMSQGIKHALILDAGIVSSDIFCIALSYFGLAQIMQRPDYRFAFGMFGGVALIAYGIYSFAAKQKEKIAATPTGLTTAHGFKLFFKGFIFNTSVPSVIFFWIGTVSLAIAQFQDNQMRTIVYLSSVVLTYAVFDLLKIYLAAKARKFFSGERQFLVKKIAGTALIIFGALIIYKVVAAR